MEQNKEVSDTPPTNLNYYWIIIFICFFVVNILKNYFNSIKIVKPIILAVILIIVLLYEVNGECKLEEPPLIQITNRALMLLATFLYCESTVKCIPIFNLTINSLFQYPTLGDILKASLAYLLTFGFNYILNLYNASTEEKEKDVLACNIKNGSNNLFITLTILAIVLTNSYLEYI